MTELSLHTAISSFLQRHKLPPSYRQLILTYFFPVANTIESQHKKQSRPLLIGINGCQGSGKTTLADALVLLLNEQYQLNTIALSIDDFYLTKAEREKLATQVHPLLKTRGVPGTHDTALAQHTINALIHTKNNSTSIPRFNKAVDDRLPKEQWPTVKTPVDVVILEGWCVGSTPSEKSDLTLPVNELESNEDPDGVWRSYANEHLRNDYQTLFMQMDLWIMLKAPSFNSVYRWRLEQEQKLRDKLEKSGGDNSGVMSEKEIQRFIQHYQRITEETLKTLPTRVNFLFTLDEQRKIINSSQPLKL